MKIKTLDMRYEQVMALPRADHVSPQRPNMFFRTLVRAVASSDLKATNFTYKFDERIKKEKGPFLILMNHSCFLDLEIISKILYPKPYCIVCTSDGFVGKPWLMRQLGCIPTQKFVSDLTLIRDMRYALEKKQTSVLMYPEASYTFDGCATPLPRRLGSLLKMLKVPVMMIRTYGAFQRDPLYNGLKKRKVSVSAEVKLLLTREQIENTASEELDKTLDEEFSFDNFKWQLDNGIRITEDFRAEGLERILYKCASCGAEGKMHGEGTDITCEKCGKRYHMDELGRLRAENSDTEFSHIPDWYAWERECVRNDILSGKYGLDIDVDIRVMVDYKSIYNVGEGHLSHGENGFVLDGCGGKLHYEQKPNFSYGLYSDYYWYELGDMICIGDRTALYYCFPKQNFPVAKARLAAEELYKIKHEKLRVGRVGAPEKNK